MKIRTKIFVDRLVGVPLAWMLNLAARLLGKLLRRDHSISAEGVRTIVIAKFVGMGSILQATPLIRSVRAEFPRARIIFLTSRGCRRLVERLEHLDAVIVVDDRNFFHLARTSLRTIATLMLARVDLYFDLEVYSAYASLVSLTCLSRNRIGFYRDSAQHKRGNYTHLMYFNARNPIRHIYLQLGRLVGCKPVEPDRLGSLRIDPSDREEVAQKLAAIGLTTGRYLVVNPNASDLMIERRWPGDRFAVLIERLLARYDLSIVLIGSVGERPYVNDVRSQVPAGSDERLVNLAGELSLGGLFALLEGCRLVITNDTGPMHMAWALGIPTVALFGPVDPQHYGWINPGVEVLYKRLFCSPCVHEVDEPPCHGNNVCMKRIAVAEVENSIMRLLSAPATTCSADGQANSPDFYSDQDASPLGRIVRGTAQPRAPR